MLSLFFADKIIGEACFNARKYPKSLRTCPGVILLEGVILNLPFNLLLLINSDIFFTTLCRWSLSSLLAQVPPFVLPVSLSVPIFNMWDIELIIFSKASPSATPWWSFIIPAWVRILLDNFKIGLNFSWEKLSSSCLSNSCVTKESVNNIILCVSPKSFFP